LSTAFLLLLPFVFGAVSLPVEVEDVQDVVAFLWDDGQDGKIMEE
jgi:hypothetical protein|tara:strand:+ start:8 stop:142 length:135 start_codon:yes stop_codon:yes gene_type:complete